VREKLAWCVAALMTAMLWSDRTPVVSAYTLGIPTAKTYFDDREGSKEFVIDLVDDPTVEELWKTHRLFEDNIFSKVSVLMVFDSKTRRWWSQAGVSFQEYDDPVDDSATRTPPRGSDGRYVRDYLLPWTLIIQRGSRDFGPNGPMHYGAGTQYHSMGQRDGTIAKCDSTAPGYDSETRYSGHNDGGQHLVCGHLQMPNGDEVAGFNNDPNTVPKFIIQGELWLDTDHPIHYFHGDAWPYVAPVGHALSGRQAMKTGMMGKVD